jgi:cytoskeletal protein RodZ
MQPQAPQFIPQTPSPLPQGSNNGHKSTLPLIIVIVIAVIMTGFAVWSFVSYMGAQTNVNGKVDDAVALAKKTQADSDAAKFAARDKEPNRQFVGPDDYGRLTFDYPKTWSVYVANDVTSNGGIYQAYLNPVSVPAVSATQQYALRVTIEQKDYDTAVSSYSNLVQSGALHSSAFSANGANGTRLDGKFSNDIRGAAVIFKIRDKTLTMQTDANTFLPDFNTLITTIKFNQ